MPSRSSSRSRASCRPAKWTCLPFPRSRFACAAFWPIRIPRWTRWYAWWDQSRRSRLRLMRIANSASLNRSGKAVTDLRTAINRIGHNMVRSASISFAMAQIRRSNKLVGLEDQLQQLWNESTSVAALSFVLARTCTRVNPDEALLVGMMHGIGKLYVLTRARLASGALHERRDDRADRRGMACLDRQGDPRELGVSRQHGAGGRGAGRARAARAGAGGLERRARGRDIDVTATLRASRMWF